MRPFVTYWRLRTQSGRLLTCDLHETSAGLELRTYLDDELLGRYEVATPEESRNVANAMRARLVMTGAQTAHVALEKATARRWMFH